MQQPSGFCWDWASWEPQERSAAGPWLRAWFLAALSSPPAGCARPPPLSSPPKVIYIHTQARVVLCVSHHPSSDRCCCSCCRSAGAATPRAPEPLRRSGCAVGGDAGSSTAAVSTMGRCSRGGGSLVARPSCCAVCSPGQPDPMSISSESSSPASAAAAAGTKKGDGDVILCMHFRSVQQRCGSQPHPPPAASHAHLRPPRPGGVGCDQTHPRPRDTRCGGGARDAGDVSLRPRPPRHDAATCDTPLPPPPPPPHSLVASSVNSGAKADQFSTKFC